MPYKRPMYCEYTPDHFKIYTPCEKLGVFLNVYAKYKDTPVIFNGLWEQYKQQWMDEILAARRARAVVKDFFTMCEQLSKKGISPFKLSINVLDFTKYKDVRKTVQLQWDPSHRTELWCPRWWLWGDNQQDPILLTSETQVKKDVRETNWKLRKDCGWNNTVSQWSIKKIPNPRKPRKLRKKILINSD